MIIPGDYLELGLTALARGGQFDWFDGHIGAALIAAYYMDREHDLPEAVVAGLLRTCEKYRAEHEEWFAPVEGEEADPVLLEQVLDGLRLNLANLRTSGHGLALGVMALKALLDRPDLCKPSIVDGVCKMLARTANDRPNRYYGIADYFAVTEQDAGVQEIAPYQSTQEMIARAFAELDVVVPNLVIDGKRHLFTGEAEHGVTHAHALYDLERLGYPDLAQMGWRNHRIQMYLNRQRPQDVLAQAIVEPAYSSVHEPEYWAKAFGDPHAIKVPYAAMALLKTLPEEERARAEFNTCKLLVQMA